MAKLVILLVLLISLSGCKKTQVTQSCVDGYLIEYHNTNITDNTTYVREWGYGKLIECKEKQ